MSVLPSSVQNKKRVIDLTELASVFVEMEDKKFVVGLISNAEIKKIGNSGHIVIPEKWIGHIAEVRIFKKLNPETQSGQ